MILDADGLGLEISNLIDITHQTNYELAMRFSTNIKSNDEFYTDLNGYQVPNTFLISYFSISIICIQTVLFYFYFFS